MATIIPSATKLKLFAKITTLSHPGIVTPIVTQLRTATMPTPPYNLQCLNMTSISSSATVPDNGLWRQGHATFTVEIRFKMSLLPLSLTEAFGFLTMASGAGFAGFQLYFDQATGLMNFRFLGNDSNFYTVSYNAQANLNTSTWYHFAATFESSSKSLIMYINGLPVAKTTTPANITVNWASGTNLNIGAYALSLSTTYQWRCRCYLDDLRIWSIVRSQDDIQTFMFGEIPDAPTGLNGYWKFNESTASTTLTDSSSSSVDGKINTGTRTAYLYRPLKRNVQLIKTTTKELFTQHATSSTIHLSAVTPKNVGITKTYPTAETIHLIAQGVKTNQAQKPTSSTVHLSAHAPKSVSVSKIYPTAASVHLSAHAPAKINFTQRPTHAVIQLIPKAPTIKATGTIMVTKATIHLSVPSPKSVSITRVYATPATIHLSAHAPKSIGISKIYPSNTNIHLSSPTQKINQVKKPSSATIHLSVSAPSNRLTQHVSRCIVQLSIPPPKLNMTVKPTPTIIHLFVPNVVPMFNQVVKPSRALIHLIAPNSTVKTIIIHYAFTVKIRRNINTHLIITTKG